MNINRKRISPVFPVWRIITGIIGALASGITLFLLHQSISSLLTIGLIISTVFFLAFIFSPTIAIVVSLAIAITAASWLMPSRWLSILLLVAGIVYTVYSDKSGLRDWLLPRFSSHRRYKKYDRRSELYKTLSYFSLLLTWLVPHVGIVSLGLLILIPLLAVIRCFRYSENISFGARNKGDLSPTADALLVTGLLMCLWTINNQQYNRAVWLYSGIFASFWTILFFIFNQEYKEKITVALGFIVCIAIFSFGAVCNVNRVYDFHTPKQYIETTAFHAEEFVTAKRFSAHGSPTLAVIEVVFHMHLKANKNAPSLSAGAYVYNFSIVMISQV